MTYRHIPGRLQISTECNQECIFCSVPEGPPDNPSLDEIKRRIIKLRKLGTNDLFITGGEPTIHPDLFKIIDFAKKQDFIEITIQSNCVNLTQEFVKKIKTYGNVKFNLSFHSYEKEVCNRLSTKDNYEKILQGLENVLDYDVNVFMTIVINELNYKKLKNHVMFIRKHFPNITHFSFNFVDPAGRAKKNKWIVPGLAETERYIRETIDYIKKNNLTFRLERVPLCYMTGIEEFSTEVRLSGLKEKRLTYFAKEDTEDINNLMIEEKKQYIQAEACRHCTLRDICPGINPNYAAVHGVTEVYPVFIEVEDILTRMNNTGVRLPENNHGNNNILKSGSFHDKVIKDLELFKTAIKNKPNKNNIYDTYSFFLMNNIGLKNKSFVYTGWKIFTDKVKKGLEPDLLAFYIHFPFCQSTCAYCVYPSTTLQDRKQIDDYIDYLIKDMKLFSPLFKGLKFKALSLGGGTPSLMSEDQLKKYISSIYRYFEFDEYAERGIEFNPNTTTFEKLKIIDNFGFNKLSIGVQSLSPSVLKKNNRPYQTIEKVKKTISDFKKTKIGYLNVDLLLGLKGDSPKDFLYTFEEILKMKPSIISLYPIKTNDNYIKKRYDGKLKNFLDFYYPLFDAVVKEIPVISDKHNFTHFDDPSKLSYVHPMDFCLKNQTPRKIKYVYTNYRTEPYSNFALGFYGEGCINNLFRYIIVHKNNKDSMFCKNFPPDKKDFFYSIHLFAPHYAKVKFITHSAYEHFSVIRKDYKNMYGKDIADDFPYAIKALELLDIIEVTGEKVIFKANDEKKLYPYLLFFVGKKYIPQHILNNK
ncbi:radical SAM protein [Candidatus Woesearchaeota archaeon]|nr:radical SAM protein [Candidatus Woesearchaeota archaeon]